MRVPFDGPPTRMTPFVTDILGYAMVELSMKKRLDVQRSKQSRRCRLNWERVDEQGNGDRR